ncbi:hypothetical protein GS471_05485 [Rhodococcus hoagii]|nr:hypothetical protein [Prescottella equi]
MTERVQVGGLQVAKVLYDFVNDEALPGTGVSAEAFWEGAGKVFADLAPKNKNKALLAKRDDLQAQIDAWHRERAGKPLDAAEYKAFLQEIGYLLPEPEPFQVATENVDAEIATTAGPQLVVPVLMPRFALNASNARWGSLYDALYGTDAISEDGGAEKGKGYNKVRGDKVIAWARNFLDTAAPLAKGSPHRGHPLLRGRRQAGRRTGRRGRDDSGEPEKFVGYLGDGEPPTSVLLRNNGLHVEIEIDPTSPIGKTDGAGVKDVVLESADHHDHGLRGLGGRGRRRRHKSSGYRNWRGLSTACDLSESFDQGRHRPVTRHAQRATAPTPRRR